MCYLDLLNSTRFDGIIWSFQLDSQNIVVDVRDLDKKDVRYYTFRYDQPEAKLLYSDTDLWWSQLIAFNLPSKLFIAKYTHTSDPNQKEFYSVDIDKSCLFPLKTPPSPVKNNTLFPSIFSPKDKYHSMISVFLQIPLKFSCEYLEWKEYIIISYTTQHKSSKALKRNLRLVKNSNTLFDFTQDNDLGGKTMDAFCIAYDKLIFVKNSSVLCTYPL